MVVITEISSDRVVKVVNGSWAIGSDGTWVFISNDNNPLRRLTIGEGWQLSKVRECIQRAYGREYENSELHLSYQWPEWMDVEAGIGERSRPVQITTDDNMAVFLAIQYDLQYMHLFVSPGSFVSVKQYGNTVGVPHQRVAEKGKAPVTYEAPQIPTKETLNYESFLWRKLMDEEAVRRWIVASQHGMEGSGESSCNEFGPQIQTTTDAVIVHTTPEDAADRSAADILTNIAFPDINLSDDDLSSSTDSDTAACEAQDIDMTGDTIRECHFFGPHANNIDAPVGNSIDLRIPLQEALEDMCLNFAAFNRDAAPNLDEQNEEGRIGMEMAINDVLYEGDELFVGRVFKNKQDCNVKLAVHAINRKFHFRRDHSDTQRMILTCFSDSCPWRVYIVKLEDSDNYQIRGAELEHTCSVEDRSHYHKQATTRVIGSIMKAKYQGNARGPRAVDLQRLLLAEHSIRISYWKAWKSREFAMEGAQGSTDNSYALLPTYLHLLQVSNPGSIVDLKAEVDAKGNHRFKFLFLAFGASLDGFTFMKRVIILDGAHLKGKYGGCLLTASCQDANYQVFPLAFGVVDGENDDAWEWFFRVLITAVPDGENLTFVSDRHSSIYTGLRRVYPRARHGACVVHLQRNVASKFKKKNLLYHVSRAARAFRICDFHTSFNEIIEISPPCAAYLESIGFCHWTRAYFLGERYNVMTSNVAESLNAVLKEARELPIISLLEFIRTTLMSWFAMRREAGRSEASDLPPKMREVIHRNFEKSVRFGVKLVDKFEYEVFGEGNISHFVKLVDRTCSCRAFDLLRLPCAHAISAAVVEGIPIQSITAPEYSVHNWRQAYKNSIKPVPDVREAYPIPEQVGSLRLFPPITRRPPGRPKKKRIPSRGEFTVRSRVVTRCSRCGGTGHNRATCKMPI